MNPWEQASCGGNGRNSSSRSCCRTRKAMRSITTSTTTTITTVTRQLASSLVTPLERPLFARNTSNNNFSVSLVHFVPTLLLGLAAWCTLSQADVFVKRDFELFFENFTCSRLLSNNSVASNYLQTLNCGLSKNVKRRTVQMELSFKRDLSDFELIVLIVLPRRRAADFVLLNISNINGCDFLANRHLVTLLQIGRKTIDKYGNFPQRCPFQKNTGYYIRGYRWDMDTLPAFAVQTTVHIHFEYVVNGHSIVQGHIKSRLDLKSVRKEAATGWFGVD